MGRLLFGLTIIVFCSSLASAVTVINSQKEFGELVRIIEIQSDSERMNAWQRFEENFAPYYKDYIFHNQRRDPELFRVEYLKKFLEVLPTIRQEILNAYAEIETTIDLQTKKFKQVFPDLSDDLTIVILPTALTFNAKAIETAEKKPILILGIDAIVHWKEDVSVLFTHEFFHLYHFNKLKGKTNYGTLASALWLEGLGVYASATLNPGKPLSQILMNAELERFCGSPEFIEVSATRFLEVFDVSLAGEFKNPYFQEWFLLTSHVPSRTGYCLGYTVAKILGKNHSLKEMSEWDEKKYSAESRKVLLELSLTKSESSLN